MKLTKREQEFILDRLEMADCLFQCLFMEDDSWGVATEEEVYAYCDKLAALVRSGVLPPASEFTGEELALIQDSVEGSTLGARARDWDDEECNRDSRHFRAFSRVANSLEAKISLWLGEPIDIPRW